MEIPFAASGAWGEVLWAVDKPGKSSAQEFFLQLDNRERARVQATFNRLADFGRIESQEQFKKLDVRQGIALWEIKRFQIRFIGAFSPTREFVVASGLKKKRDQHKSRDLDRAANILNSHFRE